MARLNVDEKWWNDPRRFEFILLVGDEELADGLMLRFWHLAQHYWKNFKQLIPRYEFEKIRHHESLLKVGLACQKKNSIYVRGSKEYHSWLLVYQASGSKGGKTKAINAKRTASEALANAKRSSSEPLPSLLSSLSSSLSSKNKKTKTPPTPTSGGVVGDLKSQIAEAGKEWETTLRHFEIKSGNLSEAEEITLARVIKREGLENTVLAIRGATLEQGTDRFDPAKHLSLMRILDVSRFQKFLTLGRTAVSRAERMTQSQELSREQLSEIERNLFRDHQAATDPSPGPQASPVADV